MRIGWRNRGRGDRRAGRGQVRLKGLLVVILMLHGCADRFILFPSTSPEDADGARRELIAFGEGHLELLAARSPGVNGREPEAFVLCFCGNAGRAEWSATADAQVWGRRPVEVWTLNYPGYGASTGPAKLALLPPAALAAYDELKRRAGDRPVFLKAESLGTAVALHVAAEREVAGLILRAPVPLRKLIMGQFGLWTLWIGAGAVAMAVPEALDAPDTAPRARAPALFLLIDTDEIVPVGYQRSVVAAYGGQSRCVGNCAPGHNGPLWPKAERELQEGLDWLWREAVGK